MERYRCRQTSTFTTREFTGTLWKLTCIEHGTTREVNGDDYSDSLVRRPASWCASCRELLVAVRCECGKSYTAAEWSQLKLVGLLNDVEVRRCSCGESTYLTEKRARLKTRPGFYRRGSGSSRGTTRRAPP